MKLNEMKKSLERYICVLTEKEFSESTRKKYLRDIKGALHYFGERPELEKTDMLAYKEYLISRYEVSTVNSYLVSVNRYLRWLGYPDLAIKTMRIQRQPNLENVITREEYKKLLDFCQRNGKEKNYLILRTLASTGIRVGELQFITCEAARRGMSIICGKGKYRYILLTPDISEALSLYCERNQIQSGVVFRGNKKNTPLHPSSVWKILKRTANAAGVEKKKVYPHSLRHLFAKTYMQRVGNLFELADILGHASIETTRIYALTSMSEKRESLSTLDL